MAVSGSGARGTIMRGLWAALGAAVWVFAASSPAHAAPPLTVPISTCNDPSSPPAVPVTVTGQVGTYPGSDAPGEMRQFLGIRYASSTAGNNRWKPPVTTPDLLCWNGNRPVNENIFGPTCPQGLGLDAWESEDCLRLNIFTRPTGTVNRQPVMVWIHGGGLHSGSGSFQTNPYPLVQQGVVVVTINYRVGALGFLAHPALAPNDKGNFGIRDQQAALQWVKKNIGKFGGDPSNVTIFGGSAGGLSVLVHLVSPLSNGLFHKAIVQSGAFSHQPVTIQTAQQKGAAFANSIGCSNAACLRTSNAGFVNQVLANQGQLGQSSFLLTQDGANLSNTIKNLLMNGKFKKLPTIVGSAHDETRFHIAGNQAFGTGGGCNFVSNVTPFNYQSKLTSTGVPGNMTGTVAGQYQPGGSDKSALEALAKQWTDASYACPTFRVNKWMAQNGGINFAYEFNDAKAPPTAFPPFRISTPSGPLFSYGAYHGAEQPFMWRFGSMNVCPGNPPPGNTIPALTNMQKQLSAAMVTYWTTFAKTGNPNNGVLPNWPEFTAANGQLASFKGTGLVSLNASSFDSDHKCSSFWDTNAP
jgi:para-nitrobenzyl esterase